MRISRTYLIAFTAGLLSALQIRVIGSLCIVEVAFIVLAPVYLIYRYRAITSGKLKPFLALSTAWLASALVSDIVRGNDLTNTLKGSFTILLWMSCLICLYAMQSRRMAAIKWYTLGLACSAVISLFYFRAGSIIGMADAAGMDVREVMNFRTTYVWVLTQFVAVLSLFAFRRLPNLVIAAMLIFATVCALNGSRNVAGTFLVAAAITYYRLHQAPRVPGAQTILPLSGRVSMMVGIVFLSVMTVVGYGYVAGRGWLGETERMRYEEQARSSIGVMSARGDVLSGMLAIVDSPIIGHGSWAADTAGYRARGRELIGLPVLRPRSGEDRRPIPAHSHIVGSWIAHGVFGGLFWIFVLWSVAQYIAIGLPRQLEYLPYAMATAVGLVWAVLASPFGQRPATAAALVFLIVSSERPRGVARASPSLVQGVPTAHHMSVKSRANV